MHTPCPGCSFLFGLSCSPHHSTRLLQRAVPLPISSSKLHATDTARNMITLLLDFLKTAWYHLGHVVPGWLLGWGRRLWPAAIVGTLDLQNTRPLPTHHPWHSITCMSSTCQSLNIHTCMSQRLPVPSINIAEDSAMSNLFTIACQVLLHAGPLP